jgi:hypothetical protein
MYICLIAITVIKDSTTTQTCTKATTTLLRKHFYKDVCPINACPVLN